jgi:hypothetical protein
MANNANGLTYSIRVSGHGYELLDTDGEVVAWILDRKLALTILLALEMLDTNTKEKSDEENEDSTR